MKLTDVRALLIAPVFLYTAALGFLDFGGWDWVVALVVVAMAVPLIEIALPASRGRWFVQ